jgi:hypothetical protein
MYLTILTKQNSCHQNSNLVVILTNDLEKNIFLEVVLWGLQYEVSATVCAYSFLSIRCTITNSGSFTFRGARYGRRIVQYSVTSAQFTRYFHIPTFLEEQNECTATVLALNHYGISIKYDINMTKIRWHGYHFITFHNYSSRFCQIVVASRSYCYLIWGNGSEQRLFSRYLAINFR